MLAEERERLLHDLESGDRDAKERAAYGLARNADSGSIDQVLAIVIRGWGDESADLNRVALDGLIDGAPATIGPLLDVFRRSPFTEAAGYSAHCLGEIAYRQASNRDPRIVPAALEYLRNALNRAPASANDSIYILRQSVFTGPIPDATLPVSDYIHTQRTKAEPEWFYLNLAMEILFANLGPAYLEQLRADRMSLSTENPFAEIIDEYLQLKAEVEVVA